MGNDQGGGSKPLPYEQRGTYDTKTAIQGRIFHYSFLLNGPSRTPVPTRHDYSLFIFHYSFLLNGPSRTRSLQIFNKKSRAKIALLFKLMHVRCYAASSSLGGCAGSSVTPFERYAICLSVIAPRAFSVSFTVMPEV